MIGYLLIGFGIVSALLTSWGYIEHTRANLAEARADTAETRLTSAQERATALALLWSDALDLGDAKLKREQEENDARFAELEERNANQVPLGRVVVFSGIAGRLFTDVTHAANFDAAGPAGVDHRRTETVPVAAPADPAEVAYDERDFTAFVIAGGAAYNDVRAKWRACVTSYRAEQALQRQQGEQ